MSLQHSREKQEGIAMNENKKEFYKFKQFIAAKGNLIDNAIEGKVNAIIKKERHFPNKKMREDFYDQTVMRQTIMELLEQYHNWLHMPEQKHK